jgi:hypothetical protein
VAFLMRTDPERRETSRLELIFFENNIQSLALDLVHEKSRESFGRDDFGRRGQRTCTRADAILEATAKTQEACVRTDRTLERGLIRCWSRKTEAPRGIYTSMYSARPEARNMKCVLRCFVDEKNSSSERDMTGD